MTIEELHRTVVDGFRKNDEQFAGIDARFGGVDDRFVSIEKRFARIDERFDRVDAEFVKVRQRCADTTTCSKRGFSSRVRRCVATST